MKKILAMLLALTMVLSLAACASDSGTADTQTSDTTAETDTTTGTDSTVDAEADAETDDPAEEETISSGVEDGVLTVGMECQYAPYNWTQLDDSNGAVPIANNPGSYANAMTS